ncbi:MAG TPA: ATP-binding protein [Pirellulales bacterium]|nr:ATP-binding protein [Pirellulales bacterium]
MSIVGIHALDLIGEQLREEAEGQFGRDEPRFAEFLDQMAKREFWKRRRRLDEFCQGRDRHRRCAFYNFDCGGEYAEAKASARDRAVAFAEGLPVKARLTSSPTAGGLILAGPVGTGKTHLAQAVGHFAICFRGLTARWANGQDLFGRLRGTMAKDAANSEEELIERFAFADVLVLDDPTPPVGELTRYESTSLYRLVNRRYEAGRPTIVTINCATKEEAETLLGAPTWDRLQDGATLIGCRWPSFRRPAMRPCSS